MAGASVVKRARTWCGWWLGAGLILLSLPVLADEPKNTPPGSVLQLGMEPVHQRVMGVAWQAGARVAEAYERSLAQLPDGTATWQGLRYGEWAAERLIALRADDGRLAPITFDMPPAPGVWRPSPTPFFDPWLSQVTPLMLDSPDQFRPPAPPPLNSALYAAEFDEVKSLGAKASTLRTPAQTETALFINSIAFAPMHCLAVFEELFQRTQNGQDEQRHARRRNGERVFCETGRRAQSGR